MRHHHDDPGGPGTRRFRPENPVDDGAWGPRPRRRHGGHGPAGHAPSGHDGQGGHGGPSHGGRRGHGGPGFGPRGRRGRSRGDVRAAVLLLLDEQPRHGYELIQEIAERSGGAWNPSPGSVYPTLQALEDEGLLTIEKVEGRRTASLTDAGRTHVQEQRDSLGTPWSTPEGDGSRHELRREAMALKDATMQVGRVGSTAQQAAAVTLLSDARKALYRLLAEDDEG